MNTTAKLTMIAGANQYSGKTTCNTARQSIHLANLYPPEWTGKRWNKPITAVACSKTLSKLRGQVLEMMFGPRKRLGSGWIPKKLIVEDSIVWSKSEKDTMEYVEVKWFDKDGDYQGNSKLHAFSFDQGWERISGYTIHDILVSEECGYEFHRELWNRLNVTKGQLVMDMIPLKGETPLWLDYERNATGNRNQIIITIDDCTHLGPVAIAEAKAEKADDPWREATLYGRPVKGTGVIFTKPERQLLMPQHRDDWPLYFQTIIGIDVPHTTGAFAAVKIVYDPEKDVVYVTEAMKMWDTPREVQIDRLLSIGGGRAPVAWPHDTARTEEDIGGHVGPIVDSFRRKGCNMLPEHAHILGIDNKKYMSPMMWISDVRDRERSGRIWYSPAVRVLLDERKNYSQAKGKIEKGQDDHCLDALGKAIFMLRHARPISEVITGENYRYGRRKATRKPKKDFYKI